MALVFSKITARADSIIGFNEGYGSTTHDSKGSASGTITSAVWKPADECVSGPCLYFNGSSNVSFGNDSTFNFVAATNWTIELWFKTRTISSGTRMLIAKYGAAGYKIYLNSTGTITFAIDDDGSWTPDDAATSTSRYDDNTWHHLAAVKTGTTSIALFIDALQVAKIPAITATGDLTNSANFYVGIDSDGSSNGWLGYIDELKVVIASARTSDQVKADYQKGATSNGVAARFGPDTSNLTNGLVGWWKMDESSGNPVDSSGNGNTLTNNGTATFSTGKFGNAGVTAQTGSKYFSIASGSQTGLAVSQFTLSAWFYPTADNLCTACEATIIGKIDRNVNSPSYLMGFFGDTTTQENGQIDVGFSTDGITENQSVMSGDGTIPSLNTWYHVVGTYDGSKISIYINGKLVKS